MNFVDLPFDAETMLQGLRPWVERESPTYDAAAVDRMLDLAARDLAMSGASIERIAGRSGFAGCIRARFPHSRRDAPGILIAGHMDTVHPVGTLQTLSWRREGDKCFGPGILDMKGGNYAALEAIRQLSRAAIETPLPITMLLTPDEEVGTPSTRDLIEAEAARNKYVLVPEPALANVGVVTGRYAIARFNLEASGKPSHAGARLAAGRSAIREMARQILVIDGMTSLNPQPKQENLLAFLGAKQQFIIPIYQRTCTAGRRNSAANYGTTSCAPPRTTRFQCASSMIV